MLVAEHQSASQVQKEAPSIETSEETSTTDLATQAITRRFPAPLLLL